MTKGIFHNWIMKCLFCHFCRCCCFFFFCFFVLLLLVLHIGRVIVVSGVSSNCFVATLIVHRSIVKCCSFSFDMIVLRMDTYAVCCMWHIQYYSLPSFDFGFWLPVPQHSSGRTLFFMRNFPHDKIKMVIARCQQNVLCLLTSNFLPFSFI